MALAKQKPHPAKSTDHAADFFRWCFRQAALLRDRRFSELDLEKLVEEIEGMGNERRRALRSSYRLIILHLLKWEYQPQRRSRSWTNTITRERVNVADEESDSKTLRDMAPELVAEAYGGAVLRAAKETGHPRDTFPLDCPYTVDQLRDPDWMPE